ncbi:TRAP transporter substrate-binding protein [Alkalihalobacillus sp. 1P02AB]|uniref:TRAP transporter substrate-binding protein n=1 Tax=Alkalihalobacillus sp. 1P02AB TaxID=3132260 RepID=UPI0039A71BEC
MKTLSIISRKFLILSALLFLLSACLSSEATSIKYEEEGVRIFKIGHVVQGGHIWNQTALKFGEELERLSEGQMQVDIFPASQLGQERDMARLMETGALDFAFFTNAYMATRQDSLNAWFMPFQFETLTEANEVRKSEPVQQMLAELEIQGLLGLDFVFAGNRHILMQDTHVFSPEDLRGQKLRIIGSPAMQSFWKQTGVGPTAMPLSEVYTALQTGVIDGLDIDLDALVAEKYYENADKLTLTNHMTFPSLVAMSQHVFDDLTTEEQKIILEAMQIAADWGNEEAIKREEANLQTLIEAGVQVEYFDNLESFQQIKENIEEEFMEKSSIVEDFLELPQKGGAS